MAKKAVHSVKTVYLIFKCHFDVGFTDTQAGVMQTYFGKYFPEAMDTAAHLRHANGPERYVWTVGSWLMSQYLEQADATQRKRVEEAVAAGDLVWHGLPFNWQSEMLDESLLEAALGFSAALDRRFGTRTLGAKLTDVPGHTRGLVGPLARAGITFLNIGVNPASTPPDVPSFFRWRDPDGAEIMVMYQPDYGGTLVVPGSELAVSIQVRGDNSGIHSLTEIKEIYAELRTRFPDARIVATGLNTMAAALEPLRSTLPVVTTEIGDTWIYGCASDPVKIACFRELSRLRREWIAAGKLKAGSVDDRAWIAWLLLAPEHTWGCDIKTVLSDWNIYTPAELHAARSRPNFKKVEATWAEKRHNNERAVVALPSSLRLEARDRLARLVPVRPAMDGLTPFAGAQEIETAHFIVALDPATGALCRLRDRRTGREWASPTQPLALFSYQTFSSADYQRFLKQYITIKDWWPPQDFGKPGLEKYPVQSQLWYPQRHESFVGRTGNAHRLVTTLTMPDPGHAKDQIAWPAQITLEWTLPDADPSLHLQLQWFDKPANRLSEALWLSFAPTAPDPCGWQLEKLNHAVEPGDVVKNGARGLHAVTRDIIYRDEDGGLVLETYDASLVAPGKRSLLNFDNALPDMRVGGVHINLFNNTWGTNYVMWLDDAMRFRFVLHPLINATDEAGGGNHR